MRIARAAKGKFSVPVKEIEREIRFFLSSREGGEEGLYHGVIGRVERILIEKALLAAARNQVQASRLLGINRMTLRNKIKKFKII